MEKHFLATGTFFMKKILSVRVVQSMKKLWSTVTNNTHLTEFESIF